MKKKCKKCTGIGATILARREADEKKSGASTGLSLIKTRGTLERSSRTGGKGGMPGSETQRGGRSPRKGEERCQSPKGEKKQHRKEAEAGPAALCIWSDEEGGLRVKSGADWRKKKLCR